MKHSSIQEEQHIPLRLDDTTDAIEDWYCLLPAGQYVQGICNSLNDNSKSLIAYEI
jgi:hypothetical protein